MAPVKFDDIPKVATSILNDDFQVSGYTFKSKQKTSWFGTSLTTQVDLFSHDKIATPSKLTLAMPKPFGCTWYQINKLEMDKSGKFKIETTKDEVLKGLKVELKSDLTDVNKVVACGTFTRVKGLQVKVEGKALNPQDFTAEATHEACCNATCGIKFTGAVLSGGLPDLGMRYVKGPFFCSLLATSGLNNFSAAASYKATPEVTVAGTCSVNRKGALTAASAAVACKGLYKVKAANDGSVSVSLKHVLVKGVTLLGGLKYSSKGLSYGCQLSLD